MDDNQDLYRGILCGQGATVIAQRIRDYLANHVRRGLAMLAPDAMAVPSDVLANYIAGTELALITWWLEHDRPYSAEHMAQMTHQLILNGAMGVLDDAS